MRNPKNVLERNPVVFTAQWAVSLMKNKLIASLALLVQGILFIVSPSANMRSTVQIGAAIIILACAANILLHLLASKKSWIDYILVVLNGMVIIAAILCFANPQWIEPYVRMAAGIVMVLSNAVNLIETLKTDKKKDWKFAVGLIVSIVMMGLGVATVIASAAKVELMQQSIGIFLILNALTNLWYIFRLRQVSRSQSK